MRVAEVVASGRGLFKLTRPNNPDASEDSANGSKQIVQV
jgi:hypothetical protein